MTRVRFNAEHVLRSEAGEARFAAAQEQDAEREKIIDEAYDEYQDFRKDFERIGSMGTVFDACNAALSTKGMEPLRPSEREAIEDRVKGDREAAAKAKASSAPDPSKLPEAFFKPDAASMAAAERRRTPRLRLSAATVRRLNARLDANGRRLPAA